MQYSRLNTNQDRRDFWERLSGEQEGKLLEEALAAIDPVSARVLRWHYMEGYSLQEITRMLNRSISTVRNHHNRGIFELQQHCTKIRMPVTISTLPH